MVSAGQQKQADARKIREAILVVLPDYKFPTQIHGHLSTKSIKAVVSGHTDVAEDERGYGFWTGQVLGALAGSSNALTVRQISTSLLKHPEHATADKKLLMVSVRNATRSLLKSGRITQSVSHAGVVYTATSNPDH